jgi:hypothetical protein
MFKDVKKVIAEIDLPGSYTFRDLDSEGWSVQDKYEVDEEEGKEARILTKSKTVKKKRQVRTVNRGKTTRENCFDSRTS